MRPSQKILLFLRVATTKNCIENVLGFGFCNYFDKIGSSICLSTPPPLSPIKPRTHNAYENYIQQRSSSSDGGALTDSGSSQGPTLNYIAFRATSLGCDPFACNLACTRSPNIIQKINRHNPILC